MCLEVGAAACHICLKRAAHHSMLCQLSDIGQDELVFQDPLHIAFTQPVAWNAICRGVLAHLHKANLSCCDACGTSRIVLQHKAKSNSLACLSAEVHRWGNQFSDHFGQVLESSLQLLKYLIITALSTATCLYLLVTLTCRSGSFRMLLFVDVPGLLPDDQVWEGMLSFMFISTVHCLPDFASADLMRRAEGIRQIRWSERSIIPSSRGAHALTVKEWSHPDVEEASLEPGNGHGDISDSAQGNLCIQVLTEGLLQLALHKLSAMQQVLIAGHHLHQHTPPIHSKAVAIECASCVSPSVLLNG